MRILVDMDGIVCDTMPLWLSYINQRTGLNTTMEDVKSWHFYNDAPFNTVSNKVILDLLQDPDFQVQIPIMPGADTALKRLHDAGHDIRLVTARHGLVSMPGTITWVRKHLPFLNIERQVMFVHDKWLVDGDVLIDDKLENLLMFKKCQPSSKVYTILYQYNADAAGHAYCVKYGENSWQELTNAILQGLE